MSDWHPFTPVRRERIAALLDGGAATATAATAAKSIDEMVALRRQLSGGFVPLDAVRSLLPLEPGLEDRLRERIFPSIVRSARALLDGEATLSLHEAGRPARTVIPRAQAAGWVAHMLLGTLPQPAPEHPHVDFAPLLAVSWPSETAKLRCVLAWFDRIADAPPTGGLEIERVVVAPRDAAAWAADQTPLAPIDVRDDGGIEDAADHLQVDFANKYLGGGVLSGGCVQEEIRFCVSPELLIGMLVSPRMRSDEAIVLRGAERYARTSGYARALRYAGAFDDPCRRAPDGTPDVSVVAIDAVNYSRRDTAEQFIESSILRELNKARAGFRSDERRLPVASGNWGCGAFRGDPPIKAIIQWLAASAEGRGLSYHRYGDERVGDLAGFATRARERHATVGGLYAALMAARKLGPGLYGRVAGG